ncbi:MAG: phosphate ABC transporter permease subunit PstC [Lentisphaerae bacterium GWF2_45_14]|nr:MAG: phosphate ABC transporter permease subunit PstC [Lentisphaerae bacterium GWF2_45_14]
MASLRKIKERLTCSAMMMLTIASGLLLFVISLGLLLRSREILEMKPIMELLTSSVWKPGRGEFGFWPFIAGSLWVTLLSALLAVPVSLLCAVYLSEYASRTVRAIAGPVLDMLSGIPSVVFGIWGVLALVPLVKDYIAPMTGRFSSGYTVLTAGIVLAVMIVPLIVHVALSVLRSVGNDLRDASLSVGATRWQTVKLVVLRKAVPGLAAAVVLGISRAFGETMAVIMVAGNVAKAPKGLLSPAYPLPALIANNYGEMLSIPLYDSALMFAAFLLLAVVIIFNIAARLILKKMENIR